MPIVQISKIIHRTGSNDDLPQLDIGEIGFATDDRRVYIGNDPILHNIPDGEITTQTEILTEVSNIDVAQIGNLITAAPAANDSTGIKGQLAYDDDYIYLCVATDSWIRAARDLLF